MFRLCDTTQGYKRHSQIIEHVAFFDIGAIVAIEAIDFGIRSGL